MKIAMICDYPMSTSEIDGGVSAASYNLVQALLQHTDAEVTVIGQWKEFRESEPRVIESDRLTVVRIPRRPRLAHLRNFAAERRQFQYYIDRARPDVIHAQGEGLYASVAVSSGYPSVYTIHGIRLQEIEMQRDSLGRVSYWLQKRLIQKHHELATDIIVINKYTEDAIRQYHSARTWTIPNAVDQHFFDLHANDAPVRGRLLLVGGVRDRKDVLTAVAVVKKLVDSGYAVTLDVAGPNKPEPLQPVNEFIATNGLENVVRIHGLVSSEKLDELYLNADIFLMTSIEESSPISIVQAMAVGKPVVSTDVGGIHEMLHVGENSFLCKVGDVEGLASSLGQLLQDDALRDSFARASREIALADWSAKAVALNTYAAYREISGAT